MFDDSVFLSWFHGPQSAGREMPESFRFGAQSILYRLLRQDLLRTFEVAAVRVKFTVGEDDTLLMRHLETLLGMPVTADDLRAWRISHDAYVADFVTYLKDLYHRLD